MAMTSVTLKLKDKVALITGSSAGMGAEIAVHFSRHGAKVMLTGRDEAKLKKIAERCEEASNGRYKPRTIAGDITDATLRKRLVDETVKHYGKMDILVNNAGNFKSLPLDKHEGLEALDAMLDVHVRVPYDMTKLAIPHLVNSKGNLINISSTAGLKVITPSNGVEYGVAKSAMDQLTRWTAMEMGPKGMRTNSINPGYIPTDILRDTPPETIPKREAANAQQVPLKRNGTVQEVANVALFLASEDASFVNGVIMPVDGGCMHTPPDMPKIVVDTN